MLYERTSSLPPLFFSKYSYDVTTGLPETILEYLLETRLDNDDESEGNSRGMLCFSFIEL